MRCSRSGLRWEKGSRSAVVVGRGEKEGGKARKDGGWGRCNIICARELFFFTLLILKSGMCVFFPYCCPAIIITIAPQIFPIVLQPTKALVVDTLGTYVPLITALYHVVLLLSELSNHQPSHGQWQIRTPFIDRPEVTRARGTDQLTRRIFLPSWMTYELSCQSCQSSSTVVLPFV